MTKKRPLHYIKITTIPFSTNSLCVIYHIKYENRSYSSFYIANDYVWSHYHTAVNCGLPLFYDIEIIAPIAVLEKGYI